MAKGSLSNFISVVYAEGFMSCKKEVFNGLSLVLDTIIRLLLDYYVFFLILSFLFYLR